MLAQRTSFPYISQKLYDITKEFVPWIHSLLYLYIFIGHNFSQELQILINFLCAIWDSPITSSWRDLWNKSEMKNKEVYKAEAIKL